ncbi:uncharacterized protein A4U43_C07F8100, partial [Asparagus officinalis]
VNGQVRKPKVTVNADPNLVQSLERGTGTGEGNHARNFFLVLTLCNTIVDTADPSAKLIDYQGESPDEQALIYAAAAYGFVLVEQTSGPIVMDAPGQRQRFKILGIHEFDSDRRRMSVIVCCPDKSRILFVKGADNSMFSVIDDTSNNILEDTRTHLHSWSFILIHGIENSGHWHEGMTTEGFEDWHKDYEKASANDVSMILTADVGIGISGQEGRQAIMASGFAMGQFRFLMLFLSVHIHHLQEMPCLSFWDYCSYQSWSGCVAFYKTSMLTLKLFQMA